MRTSPYPVLLAASLLALSSIHAQTLAPQAMAAEGPTLVASAGANDNRCAVVFNPEARLYYSLDAGCMRYPVDTYDERGTLLSTVDQGFDYRGAWWDPVTKQLEGNGHAEAGLFVQSLDGTTRRPLGTGLPWHEAAQPQPHSSGTLDTEADLVIYYHDGAIHRYTHATNSSRGRVHIKGLPVALSALNDNSVVFTGMPGYEYGLYDHTQRRVLFVNKSTGEYAGFCQLPASAPARTTFGMSYANGYFWLFDAPSNPGTWRSYRVFVTEPGVAEVPEPPVPVFALDESDAPEQASPADEARDAEIAEMIERIMAELEALAAQAETDPVAEVAVVDEVELEPSIDAVEVTVSLFPVPARDLLRVELSDDAPLRAVRVLDLAGREVPTPLTRTGPGAVQLDVQGLVPGTYGLQVVTADGEATGHRFTVAR